MKRRCGVNFPLFIVFICMLITLLAAGCSVASDQDTVAPAIEFSRPTHEDAAVPLNDPHLTYEFSVFEEQGLSRLSIEVMGNQTMIRVDVCGGEMPPCPTEAPANAFAYDVPLFPGANEVFIVAEDFSGNVTSILDRIELPTLDIGRVLSGCTEHYDLMILAPEAFEASLQSLVWHKNSTGTPAVLHTIEAIDGEKKYAQGRDIQERIKLAIADAEECWGIRYVMLVGDVDRFPVRYTRVWDTVHWGHSFAPSDLYYADLYDASGQFDDWDADGDDFFGEMNAGNAANWAELNQDDVDLRPDVAVGRIPVSTIGEVETMIKKIASYEIGAFPAWTNHIVLIDGNFANPQPFMTQIATQLAPFGFVSESLNETNPACGGSSLPPCSTVRANTLNSAMNSGVGFVAYFGHGYGGTPGTTDGSSGGWAGWYDYQSIAGLTNNARLPIITAAACDTAQFHFPHLPYQQKNGAIYTPSSGVPNSQQNAPEPAAMQPSGYDQDAMPEHFMVKQPAGAVAYFGGYTGVQPHSFDLVGRMFDEYVALGGTAKLGDVWMGGVERYIDNEFGDIPGYWGNWYAAAIYHHIQKMMLFGDPSLQIGGTGQPWDICQVHPEICDLKVFCKECLFRYLRYGERIRFLDMFDRYVIYLDEVGQVFGEETAALHLPRAVEVRVSSSQAGLAAEVYDDAGIKLVERDVGDESATIFVERNPDRRYLLVLRPTDEATIGKLLSVDVAVAGR